MYMEQGLSINNVEVDHTQSKLQGFKIKKNIQKN